MRMSKPFRRFVAATLVGLMGLAIEGGMARAGELTKGGWKMTFPDTVKLEEGDKDPKTLRLKATLTFKDLNRINIKFEPMNVNGTFRTKEDAEELKQVREEVPKEYVNVEATIDNQSKKPWDMLTFRLTDAFDTYPYKQINEESLPIEGVDHPTTAHLHPHSLTKRGPFLNITPPIQPGVTSLGVSSMFVDTGVLKEGKAEFSIERLHQANRAKETVEGANTKITNKFNTMILTHEPREALIRELGAMPGQCGISVAMTDWSGASLASGEAFPTAIAVEVPNATQIDNVYVTMELSTASGAGLVAPSLDPERPADFDLSWTGSPYSWSGEAYLGSLSSTGTAYPVLSVGAVPADDSMTVTGRVDYTCAGEPVSVEVSYGVALLVEPITVDGGDVVNIQEPVTATSHGSHR
jgi:hypothetical protein